jgi:hypothetical protein
VARAPTAIPDHVVAYAAGLRSGGAPWSAICEVLRIFKLGDWPEKDVEDACLDWLYEHVEVPGLFARALRGAA